MVTDKKIVLDAAVTIKLLDRFSDLTDQMLLVDETFRELLETLVNVDADTIDTTEIKLEKLIVDGNNVVDIRHRLPKDPNEIYNKEE
tara:strand:+ start:3433 stop:3693 length:261 start_codon:yes stop_codon:yes gene_type:complete